jgi:hypothetical protein
MVELCGGDEMLLQMNLGLQRQQRLGERNIKGPKS